MKEQEKKQKLVDAMIEESKRDPTNTRYGDTLRRWSI
jgi:hypothetical protein